MSSTKYSLSINLRCVWAATLMEIRMMTNRRGRISVVMVVEGISDSGGCLAVHGGSGLMFDSKLVC